MADQTDEEIALRVQQGDVQAFGVLVERYQAKLLRYAGKFVADEHHRQDIIQEVFLKSYQNIRGFDTSRKFSPWIYRIAHNELVNVLRGQDRKPLSFFDPDTLFPHPEAAEQADDEVKRQETKRLIEQYLNQLDTKYREVLVLYYYEEMDYKQISEIIHIPVSTVGIRIKRGREALRKLADQLTS